MGGLDDEVAGFGGEDEGDVGGCVDILNEGGDGLGGLKAEQVKCEEGHVGGRREVVGWFCVVGMFLRLKLEMGLVRDVTLLFVYLGKVATPSSRLP